MCCSAGSEAINYGNQNTVLSVLMTSKINVFPVFSSMFRAVSRVEEREYFCYESSG